MYNSKSQTDEILLLSYFYGELSELAEGARLEIV